MSFNFQRHIRLAGVVVSISGLFLHNWTVVLLGWTIVALGYMATISKLELWVEGFQTATKKEDEDASC